MNKAHKTICIAICLAFVFSSFQIAYADTPDKKQSNVVSVKINTDEENVKDIINQYYTNELETMCTLKAVDSSTLILNENLKQFSSLNNNLKAKWYESIDEKLIDYTIYLNYISIKLDGNTCNVDLIKGTDLFFEKSPEINQQSRGEKHLIILKKDNNKWAIEQDNFEVDGTGIAESMQQLSSASYDEKLKKESNVLKSKILNVKVEAEKLKNDNKYFTDVNKLQSLITPQIVSGYNGSAAVSYAYKYWDYYNPAYTTYSSSDCTNFVSQCIKAGGVPTDGTWYKNSNAWIRVIEIRSWLLSKGYAKELTWSGNCKEGDIIQLYNAAKSIWSHSLLISYRRTDGQIFITCHTSDHYNYAYYNYYPTSAWSKERYLKLTS